MAGDYSKIHRLLRVLQMAQSATAQDAGDIARELGVTERTAYRDLEALQAAGFPLVFDRQKRRYVIRGATYMKPVDLTIDEALSIVALGQHVGGDNQIPGLRAAADAVEKIRSQLPASIREQVADLDPYLRIKLSPTSPPDESTDVYETVRRAIAERVKLDCAYESNTGSQDPSEPFRFSPYTLFFNERAWYVIGYHGGRKEVRLLKLARFVRCSLTSEAYEIPREFSLQEYLGNAWRMISGKPTYDVELHFEKRFAATVGETQWHATQETEVGEDGTLIFRCRVDGLDEIVWWVMSMGPHCRVVKPPELADRVRELAERTVALYSKK